MLTLSVLLSLIGPILIAPNIDLFSKGEMSNIFNLIIVIKALLIINYWKFLTILHPNKPPFIVLLILYKNGALCSWRIHSNSELYYLNINEVMIQTHKYLFSP